MQSLLRLPAEMNGIYPTKESEMTVDQRESNTTQIKPTFLFRRLNWLAGGHGSDSS